MDRQYSPESLRASAPLDLRNINGAAWEAILSNTRAADLRLYRLLINSLDGIERLQATHRLAMNWANKIADLTPVFQMRWLESLDVSDFPRIRSIEGIDSLHEVKELRLSGNLGSLHPPMRLDSAKPIAKLHRLQALGIWNARLDDDDLTFVAGLSELRHLDVSSNFERTQLAYLAKRLNDQLEDPIRASRELGISCQKCGERLVLFVGRRMPAVCRSCDSVRFDRLTVEFEALVAAA
jgi:hypothetical protein